MQTSQNITKHNRSKAGHLFSQDILISNHSNHINSEFGLLGLGVEFSFTNSLGNVLIKSCMGVADLIPDFGRWRQGL